MTPPLIYMNNAATTWPKPPCVSTAVNEAMQSPVFDSGRATGRSDAVDYVELARSRIAGHFHIPNPEHIVFTHNATDALNILIAGFIRKNPHCHAVATALDHNSVLRPLHEYARAGEITLSIADIENGHVSAELLQEKLTKETKLVVMSHASNVLGSVQNLEEIGKLLHDLGIFFLVDGAQTAGHMALNIPKLSADAYVFTGHKALLGIPGTGGFYLKDEMSIVPTRFGGTGTQSQRLYQPEDLPEKFETGTHNHVGLAALAAGIRYLEEKGIDSIQNQEIRQAHAIIRSLLEEPNITVHYQNPEVPVISFNINHLSNDDVGFILAHKFGIITRTGLHCAPLVHKTVDDGAGSVRLSLSCMTTDVECERTIQAIQEVAESAFARFHSA